MQLEQEKLIAKLREEDDERNEEYKVIVFLDAMLEGSQSLI